MTKKKAAKSKPARRKRVNFRFEAKPDSDVRLAGTFNNWDVEAHRLTRKKDGGTYSITLLLPPGRYEYKFIVNGEWLVDPLCLQTVTNPHGTLNSVIVV